MSARPLHVLMTADAVGGVWRYAIDLARGICAAGDHVTLAVLGPAPDPAQRAEAAGIPGLDLLETPFPLDWLAPDADALNAAGAALATLSARLGADVVHLNSPALAAASAFRIPVLAACHSCVATWWRAVHGEAPMPPDFAWRRDLTAAGYRAADQLVAPSAAFAVATARAHRLPAVPRVVHNGRATCTGAPPAGLPSEFVFTAGRLWDEGKGLTTLDAAARQLPLPVLAAGPLRGPHGAGRAPANIRCVGPIAASAVADILAARPIFVSAARYEPFGLAVLEAAQAGCALVLSDIPSFRELWSDVAEFVPPGDAAALARAIRGIVAAPALRARRGAAARAHAARYSVGAMVEGTARLHRALLRAPAMMEDTQ